MKNVTEVIFCRYKKGTTPGDGEVLWSSLFYREEYNAKKAAIERLTRIIQYNDPRRYILYRGDTALIKRERKDAPFNSTPEVIWEKKIDSRVDMEIHVKALSRLCKHLTKNDEVYQYYGTIPFKSKGENCYQLATRSFHLLDEEDREKALKRKISGKKSALTRSLNRMKKIRNEYKNTLFPEAYREDPVFQRLFKYISDQKLRWNKAKRATIDEIDMFTGSMCERSWFTIHKRLGI